MIHTAQGLIQTFVGFLTWPTDEDQILLAAQLSCSRPQPVLVFILQGVGLCRNCILYFAMLMCDAGKVYLRNIEKFSKTNSGEKEVRESRRGCQLHLSLWVNELQEGRRRHPTVNTHPLISTTPLPSRKECSISPISGSPLANNEFWQILKYWQFDEWKKLLLYCWILLSLLY